MDIKNLKNPIWERADNLRDPSVFRTKDGYLLFYTRYSNWDWSKTEDWSVACVFTKDFVTFEGDRDVTDKGFASPGDVVYWGGRYILPYMTYPISPNKLHYSESNYLTEWSRPKNFLDESRALPWNTYKRAIDPTFVVNGDTLHCYFVGSSDDSSGIRANLVGHAVTKDYNLEKWDIITVEEPLIGRSKEAPDGAENITVFKCDNQWVLIYSEGLEKQHLAYAESDDLYNWSFKGKIDIPAQKWTLGRYGAPFVWNEDGRLYMILMGEDMKQRTRFGLLTSYNGITWDMLEEKD